MNTFAPYLAPLEKSHATMPALVESWANINSGSSNLPGLRKMLDTLKEAFAILNGDMVEIDLPSQKKFVHGTYIEELSPEALSITMRPEAPIQILLGGHMDTVFPANSPFQSTEWLSPKILKGPGVADMKGGLAIMLTALELFEKTPWKEALGWHVLITPDEEIGSNASADLYTKASHCHAGLIFEPSLANGAFVSSRKGSINYTAVAKGKAAHAGRDFSSGKSAIYALAHFIYELEKIIDLNSDVTINVGVIEGGLAANIVPEKAFCHFNVRMNTEQEMAKIIQKIEEVARACGKREGISLQLHRDCIRPPKLFDDKTEDLFKLFQHCASELDMPFHWQPSGGVCDGNILAAAGLPTIDTLGAAGGNIHTFDEFIHIDSLCGKASLTALFLMKIAKGDLILPTFTARN